MTENKQTSTSRPALPRRHHTGCLLCGKPLVYHTQAESRTCAYCGKTFYTTCTCENGHYVCDACHRAALPALLASALLDSREKDPQVLLTQTMTLPAVHMHGPEHHILVPCVLLTACLNSGGRLDLTDSIQEAIRRAEQIPGGSCGYWGACGAAIGAGIYLSILTGSSPLNREMWPLPQQLTARCLQENAKIGGPRCCKRTSRTAIETAVAFTEEKLGISMPHTHPVCTYAADNQACLHTDCPYFPASCKEPAAQSAGDPV